MADDSRQQPFFFLLLLAVLGVGTPLLSRSSGAASPGATAATSPASTAAPAAPSTPPDGCLKALERSLKTPARVLVATVPDPIESVTDYGFDRELDAIRRAVTAAEYQSDRFCLPWTEDRRARADKDGDKGRLGRSHQSEPGWMLFRGPKGPLLVLLVGETATWGVQPEALQSAFTEATRQGAEINIAGPTFSGTAQSLREGLERFACAHPERATVAHVVSGSATNAKIGERLTVKYARVACKDSPQSEASLSVSFDRTVIDDEQTLDRFSFYLKQTMGLGRLDNNCQVKDMALLAETGTGYGDAVRTSQKDVWGCPSYRPVLIVQYPPHVARIRAEYEQQRRRLGGKKEAQELPSRALELSLDVDRPEDRTEVLPNLSVKTTYSEELQLTNTLAAMCRQEMRWVGILGTDTIDRLFLAHEVKSLCPNVRLFFLESDVLYTHPEYSSDLDGSVVISPYPLLPQNRAWTTPFDSDTLAPFASQSDQGLYNAVLLLLDKEGLQRERFAPFCETHDRDNAAVWVTAIGNGSVWPVAVLGKLRAPPPGGSGDPTWERWPCALHAGRDASWIFDAPGQWRFALTLLSLLGALLAVGYWAARLRPAGVRLPWGLGWAEVFAQPAGAPPSVERAIFRLLALVPATLVYGLGLLTALIEELVYNGHLEEHLQRSLPANVWHIAREEPQNGVPVVLIASLLVLAAVDVVVATALPLWWWASSLPRRRTTRESKALIVLVDLALFGVVIALIALSFRGINPLRDADPKAAAVGAILFRERNGNLTSGLSLLVPALALGGALFLCGYFNLRRLGPAPEAPGRLLFPRDDHFEVAGGAARAARLAAGMRHLAGSWIAVGLAIFASVLAFLPFRGRIGTLEFTVWNSAIWWGTLLALILTLASLFGFAFGWQRLRALLSRVASLPLAAAWGRLPARYAVQLGGMLLARPPDITEIEGVVRTLHRLIEALPDHAESPAEKPEAGVPRARLQELRCTLEAGAREVDDRFAAELRDSSGRAVDATIGATYARLCSLGEEVMKVLVDSFRVEPPPEPAPSEPAWRTRGEDLVVMLAAGQIFHALARLRGRLTLSLGATLLLLVMVVSYPFERRHSLSWLMGSFVVLVVGVALSALVQMSRDEVLSYIQRTTPGSISWDRTFVVKLVLFAVLPLSSVAAASVPALGQALFGWVVPLLKLMQ